MINYRNFTGKGLQLLHDAVHQAIALDTKAKKRGEPPPCHTTETEDWQELAKNLEDEMARRDVPFIPVRFLNR
jgi:hypothetical protein